MSDLEITRKNFGKVQPEAECYLHGDNPERLLLTVTHGDEKEVRESVKQTLELEPYQETSYLYVPEVSPSASKAGTRRNAQGIDLNRSFNDETNLEVIRLKNILDGYQFKICISFHEDPESDKFYMYDCYGKDLEGSEILEKIRREIRDLDVDLLDGFDDSNDPSLGWVFHQGYRYYPLEEGKTNPGGFFANWAYGKGYIQRYINPEIPGKLPLETKTKIVNILMKYLFLDQNH